MPAAFGEPGATAAADSYLTAPGAAGLFASSSSSADPFGGGVAAWARGLRGGSAAFGPAASADALTLTPPLAFAAPRANERSPPARKEKWVISFGLYGAHPKYVGGAMRNAELQPTMFPGWVCRFYVDDSVPASAIHQLHALGAETVIYFRPQLFPSLFGEACCPRC